MSCQHNYTKNMLHTECYCYWANFYYITRNKNNKFRKTTSQSVSADGWGCWQRERKDSFWYQYVPSLHFCGLLKKTFSISLLMTNGIQKCLSADWIRQCCTEYLCFVLCVSHSTSYIHIGQILLYKFVCQKWLFYTMSKCELIDELNQISSIQLLHRQNVTWVKVPLMAYFICGSWSNNTSASTNICIVVQSYNLWKPEFLIIKVLWVKLCVCV